MDCDGYIESLAWEIERSQSRLMLRFLDFARNDKKSFVAGVGHHADSRHNDPYIPVIRLGRIDTSINKHPSEEKNPKDAHYEDYFRKAA